MLHNQANLAHTLTDGDGMPKLIKFGSKWYFTNN